ncbi:MAG: hypothetical protein H0T79_14165, partial [Deltaproteobacteria bacterium]|nr:hypothetical protein [Deltaproteobacteria bacterium]
MRFKLVSRLLVLSLALSPVAMADVAKKTPAPAKKADPKAKPAKPAPPKKLVAVSAANKKVLAELYAGFKFGMTKDEVVAVLAKDLEGRWDDKIKATTDVNAQDRLRQAKKRELADIKASYTSFEGKKTGWDVSIVEEEFAHNTNESMLDRWEKTDGKNERRFFFFSEGKLWKMFVSLDVSMLPEDKKNFETFRGTMEKRFGPGNVEPGYILWHTEEFDVRAIDKLKSYDTLGLVIEDTKVKKPLLALREAKAPPKKETSSIIKGVIDVDNKDKPDVKTNNNAV